VGDKTLPPNYPFFGDDQAGWDSRCSDWSQVFAIQYQVNTGWTADSHIEAFFGDGFLAIMRRQIGFERVPVVDGDSDPAAIFCQDCKIQVGIRFYV
jgi:hypothetical protein